MDDKSPRMPVLVAQVAAAYFSNSQVAVADIPVVMRGIAEGLALELANEDASPLAEDPIKPAINDVEQGPAMPSAAQIRQSVRPDGLVSFENGRTYRTLKRHLSLRGLAPKQYREKWGLPADYPMTAASYSAERSAVAKRIGLGGRPKSVPKRRQKH